MNYDPVHTDKNRILESYPKTKQADLLDRHSGQHTDNDLLTLLNIKVVSTIESFNALRKEWIKLNDQSIKGTLFSSWEWLYTWWKTYCNDGQRTLYILACYDHKEKLIGIAPFQIVNNPKRYFPCNRQLLSIGTGETDGSAIFGEYMDLIIKPNYEDTVTNIVSEFLFENKALWDGIKFQQLLDESHLANLFKNQTNKISQSVTPYGVRTVVELPNTYKEYLMSLRKKMRNNITRVWKRLEDEQQFTLDRCDSADNIHSSLNTLADLNVSRRGAIQQSSVFGYERFNQFHHKIVEYLQPENKLRLHILRFNNEPVAALYSFIDRKMIHIYQSGFKEEYGQRYSLMTTMLAQEIAASIEDKEITRYNFMFSEDAASYKARFSSKTETMYNISYEKNNLKAKLYTAIHGPIKSFIKKLIALKNNS